MELRTYQRKQLMKEAKKKTLSTVLLVLLLLITLPTFVISGTILFTLLAERESTKKTNERDAIIAMRTIMEAQERYAGYFGEYGTFAELRTEGLIDKSFSGETPLTSGYVFKMNAVKEEDTGVPAYTLQADPLDSEGFFSATGTRRFFVSSKDRIIRFNGKQTATGTDPAVKELPEVPKRRGKYY
jgi:hypothetical protein